MEPFKTIYPVAVEKKIKQKQSSRKIRLGEMEHKGSDGKLRDELRKIKLISQIDYNGHRTGLDFTRT